MSNELEQLKTAFEQLGMSPEEIAEDRGLDLVAVKAGLMQCSSAYRKSCNAEEPTKEEFNFTQDDMRRVQQGIMELALGAEDDNLRFKALTYVRDDYKGRRDVVRGMKNTGGINILQFNQIMAQTRGVADKVKGALLSPNQKVVNV